MLIDNDNPIQTIVFWYCDSGDYAKQRACIALYSRSHSRNTVGLITTFIMAEKLSTGFHISGFWFRFIVTLLIISDTKVKCISLVFRNR